MQLTPPRLPIFLISIVLAALAIGDLYQHVPQIHGYLAAHRFWVVVAAYVLLVIGVVFPGV